MRAFAYKHDISGKEFTMDWFCWLSLGIIVVLLLLRVNFFRGTEPKLITQDMDVIDPLYIGRILFVVIIALIIAILIGVASYP